MNRIWNTPNCHEMCWACAWTRDGGGEGGGQPNRFKGVIMIHLDEEIVQGQGLVKMVMVL